MNDVLIHSPFSRKSSQGNSVTAARLEKILTGSGLGVIMETERRHRGAARCLIALNARRSAKAVGGFRSDHPGKLVVVILTGTDINHPEMREPASPTRRTMDVADALVVLHEAELQSLPSPLRGKTHVIYPSVDLPRRLRHQALYSQPLRVIMAGNIRAEKNTRLAADACALLVGQTILTIVSYGGASASMADEMRLASTRPGNFHWHGQLSRAGLMSKMGRAHLLLNTSIQEGGANAICEAVCLGLPVLASRITGNVGMLGGAYAGYFPSGDALALGDLLARVASDPVFYDFLKKQTEARASVFSHEKETRAWVELMTSLISPKT